MDGDSWQKKDVARESEGIISASVIKLLQVAYMHHPVEAP